MSLEENDPKSKTLGICLSLASENGLLLQSTQAVCWCPQADTINNRKCLAFIQNSDIYNLEHYIQSSQVFYRPSPV